MVISSNRDKQPMIHLDERETKEGRKEYLQMSLFFFL